MNARSAVNGPRRFRSALVLGLAVLLTAGAAAARLEPADPDVPIEARRVLEQLAQAFTDGDHRAVADLVHPDGIRLGLGPDPERISELTAAQAHYYFKALFQTRQTLSFEYLRHHAATGDRVLARAVWRSRGANQGTADMQRVLVTLARHEQGWRLTELTALRGG
ncbi:MAG: nuclear transport factor 2 family protein [Candidatus Krumholzibacteriia bacterium]